MARRLNICAVVVLGIAFLSSLQGIARADEGPDFGGAQTGTIAREDHVDGWLLISQSPKVNAISTRSGGCGGCTWVVFQQCSYDDAGQPSAEGDLCLGPNVSCGAGQLRNYVEFSPAPGEPLTQVDSYCYQQGEPGLLTAATIAPDFRRYADRVAVAAPTVRAWPPGGTTLVNLPTYFAVTATDSAATEFGGQGYTMQISVGADSYTWDFGDGTRATTTDEGGPPPAGSVHHTYRRAGEVLVSVSVNYGARYRIVTPAGAIGPLEVPGGPVRTLPAIDDLRVQEAYAGLIR